MSLTVAQEELLMSDSQRLVPVSKASFQWISASYLYVRSKRTAKMAS